MLKQVECDIALQCLLIVDSSMTDKFGMTRIKEKCNNRKNTIDKI